MIPKIQNILLKRKNLFKNNESKQHQLFKN